VNLTGLERSVDSAAGFALMSAVAELTLPSNLPQLNKTF
jgi:hypothetical protein